MNVGLLPKLPVVGNNHFFPPTPAAVRMELLAIYSRTAVTFLGIRTGTGRHRCKTDINE